MFWFYIGLFIVFVAIEAVSFNLITIWMAISAFITSLYAWFFPTQYVPQAFIFIVLSIILIAITKPVVRKFIKAPNKTNADSLIGEVGIVTVAIDSLNLSGQVKVRGQIWSAKSETDGEIAENKKVKILKIEGVKLVVEPID